VSVWGLRARSAVAGVGWTDYSKRSGRTVLSLAVQACLNAIKDAGIEPSRVDGILTYGLNDTVHPQAVATAIGLPRLSYYANYFGGGNVCAAAVGTAAMVVASGMADNILVFRALNGRSEHRLGGTGMDDHFALAAHESQFTFPFGWLSYPQYIAMAARRHMLKYGTSSEDFAYVAVTCRDNAVRNERAMMREPITINDHQRSRMIADPLRLLDICLESDGACALLVCRAEEARALRHKPVFILSFNQGGGPRPGYAFDGFYTFEELADLYGQYIAPKMWALAGLGPADVDVASIYDCFTFSVIAQLEGFGFCNPGEGGQFVRDGRISLTGELPINPSGGMLSEAYIHGLNGIVEIVMQLRGDSGSRQVVDAEIGMATGFGVTTGCGVVMSNVT
jgi:acetyl-CoA acetyltransferase